MPIQERYLESLESAQRALQIADHMTYITFPLVKEKRLLLKVLSELSSAITSVINAILQYEYYWKRIQIYSTARDNFETFKQLAPRYSIHPDQLAKITEIVSLAEKHKKSPFEFVKNDKIVIMSDSLAPSYITLEKIKIFLLETKDIIKKANLKIKSTA